MKHLSLCRLLPAVYFLLLFAVAPSAWAQVQLTTINAAYTQDFNSLAATGTSSTLPTGFTFTETGTAANTTYTAGTGSGTTGDTYSFGAATGGTAAERAFGGLRSGSLIPTIGASFVNNTGTTITSLNIAYTGEAWRVGTINRVDQLDFQYSTNATSLTVGTYIDVNALDFTTPTSATITTGAKDGNAVINRTVITGTISGLSIAPGATFWIRYTDVDVTGADDGLAIDDFSLTPVATPRPDLLTSVSGPTSATLNQPYTYSIVVSNIGTAAATGVTANFTLPNNVAFSSATGEDRFIPGVSGRTVSFTNGSLAVNESYTLLVEVRPISAGPIISSPGSATVDPGNTIAETNEANNTSTETVTTSVVLPTVNLSVSSNTSSETSPAAITVTATSSAPVLGDQTVSVAVTGTGITASDYTLSNSTITIPNGQTQGSVTFTIVDDVVFEGPETATLTISNPSANIALGGTTAQDIAITDNDPQPLPDLTVSVSGPASATASQAYTYSLVVANGGVATATGIPVSFTLPAGVTFVSAPDAGGFTATQMDGVVLFTGGNITPGNSATLTVTVSPDAAGTVTVSPGAAFVDPNNAIAESNEANNMSGETVTTSVVAACPAIVAALTGTTTICAGSTANLTVTVTGSTGPFSLTYSDGTTNAVVGSYVSGTNIPVSPATTTTYTLIALTDANACPGTVSGVGATITVNLPPTIANAGPAQTITLGSTATLAANTPTTGTGMWSVTSGPSTDPTQFSSVTDPMATFTPAGGAGEYVLTWTISNAPCPPSTSTVTITVAKPTVNLSVGSNTASETAPTAIVVTATASAPVVGDQTVSVAVTGTGITTGDYTLSSPTITIPNGQLAGSVTFTVVDDVVFEGPETATLTISNPSANIALGGTTAQDIAITDNDPAPQPDLTITVSGPASATVNQPYAYSLVVSNGGNADATGISASFMLPAGVTYSSAAGTNGFAASQTGGVVAFTGGSITQGASATLTVTVSPDATGVITSSPGSATVDPDNTIAESNEANNGSTETVTTNVVAPTVNLSVSMGSIAEDSPQTITVSATTSFPVTGDQTVTLSPTGSATFLTDYFLGTQGNATITIPDGQTQGSTTFNVLNDTQVEGAETATLTISSVTPGLTIGATPAQSITITDDDVAPTPALVVNPMSLTFTTTAGTASAEQSYVVSATALTADITLTASAGVEISQTSGSGFSSSLTLPGSTASATIYARLTAGAAVANQFSGTITHVSGSLTATVAVSGTVTAANTAPTVANTIPPQSATVNQSFNYVIPANTFADANGDALSLSVAGLPAGLTFNGSTSAITGTPTTATTVSVTVTATDPGSLSVSTMLTLTVNPTPVVSVTGVVISQVYGGGGNANAPFRSDYIELFNRTNAPISINGWSVQYAAATGTSWQSTTLTGSIPAGGYYLVQQATTGTTAAALPTPDAMGTTNLSGTAGKVALVSVTTALSGSCPSGASIVDFVGYGTMANCFEGAGPTPAPSNTMAALRKLNGCTETNNNSADFATGAPTPRNSASMVNVCGAVTPLALTLTASPTMLLTTGTTTLSATVSGGSTPYSYTFSGPGTIAQNGNMATVSNLPAGVQTFTVRVADATSPTSQTISAMVSVTVSAANTAPTVANAIPPQSATVGQTFSYVIPANTFADADGDALTLSASGLPDGLSFSGSTSAITGTPSTTVGSPFTVTVTATDPGSLSASTTFAFTINNADQPPVAPVIPNQVATTGTPFSFTVPTFSDPENQPLTYTASGIPAPLTFDPATRVISGTPSQTSVSAITITATDPASNTASATFSLTVNAGNQPPVAPTIAPQSGTVAVAFSYTVPAFTDESANLTYVISGLPAGLTADNTTRVISGTPTATGTSTVTVVATDPQSASSSTSFTITINANQAPVAAAIANQTATVGVVFSFTVPAFSDPENQMLTYAATGIPAPLTFDAATRVISGTPSQTSVSAITITATDPASNTVSATFSLTVNPVPAAGDIQITEYMYNGSAGEFIELTNVGNAAIDLTGWSFDDLSATAGAFSISGFGVVQPGESVIISEPSAATFRANWYLPATVKVVGGNNQNLGNGDAINIFNASGTLVDRLVYGSSGNPITNGTSAWPTIANLSSTTAATWQLSVVGDEQDSYAATTGNVGNPGGYYRLVPRVKVAQSGGTTTVTEGGATDTYTVVLNTQPTADVTVTINAGSQLTVNPATLTFTPANFNTAQTVTVTAVDDASVEGVHSATITQGVTSADLAYNAIPTATVSVTITDNDVAANQPPTIQVASTTTRYLSLPANGPGFVSGVANDPTDPASTLGVSFTLTDADTDVNSLTVTATSSTGNATLNLTGTGSTRNLKITPAGVGYSTITVTVTDGPNATNYVINYAASAASSTPGTTRFHTGTSDASTAIAVDGSNTLVADDENQTLRLYDRQNSGLPIVGFDFTSLLGLTDVSGGVPREVDLEASIRQGNRIFWIGSLSNADDGDFRPNRNRVFATDLSGSGAATTLSYVGRYDFLRNDIINWDVTNGHGKGANYYGLQASAATGVGAKQSNGFNVEGAEFAPDNSTVYVSFRAPQVLPANRTKALIVPVTNLTTLVSGQPQGSATFGAPIELDLGGRGIREIRKNSSNQYVIVAGAAGDVGAAPNDFRLFTWTGNAGDAPVETNTNLAGLNANGSFESIVEVPASVATGSQLQLLVDNGDAVYYNDGTAAKDLAQNNFKKFRSDLVTLGAPLNTAPTVANAIPPQSATVGQMFTYVIPANTFADTETPNSLVLSVSGLPQGLSFVAPATISGTPSLSGTSTVTVTATDPGSLSASTTFTITVNPAPVVVTPLALTLTASPTMLLTTGTTTLSATVSGGSTGSPDRPYSYTFSGPGTIAQNGNTATVSNLPVGVQTFTVRVADATSPNSQTISGTVSVTVNQANQPPVAPTIAPQSGTVAVAFSYTVPAFTDESANLTYAITGLPAGLTADNTTRVISGTPTTTGTSTVTVVATDPQSASSSTSFTITINANQAPVAAAIANQTATVGVVFSFTVPAFSDPENQPLIYAATGIPAPLTFDAATRVISGTPSQTSVSTITITATDPASNTVSVIFSLTVNPAPVVVAPLALTLTANPTMLLTTGTTTLSATVSGGSTPYSYTFSGPGTIAQNGNTATVSNLPAGVQTFTVKVADATSPTSQTISATVSVTVSAPAPMNTAPTVANAIPPQSATVNQGFSYVIPANTFADANGDALSLSVSGLPMGLSFNGSTSAITGTPSLTGTSTVTVTATDPGSLSVSTSFTLTVNPAGTTPTPTGPFAITSVTTVSCSVIDAGRGERSVTFSPQYSGTTGQPITFRVVNELAPTTASGPYTLRLYSDNPVISLRASQSGTAGEATFSYNWLAACNGTTPPANTAPTVANAIPPQSATVGQAFSFVIPANTFTDAETPNSLSLSVSGLPMGLSFVAPATITGTPSVSGTGTVTVTATDPGSLSVSTTFTLTVNPAGTTPTPTGPFAITSVTTVSCTPVADRINLSFNPQYTGVNGQPITFSVVNELAPTTAAGPYTLSLYTDNPVLSLRAVQSGVVTTLSYNWLAACNGTQPANTAPTVANAIPPQSATVGQAFSYVIPANTFADADGDALSLSVSGLPMGLSFNGSTSAITGTPSMTGVSTVTVTATDPGSLSVSTSFTLTVNPAGTTPTPTGPFAITSVATVSCSVIDAGRGERSVTFSPQYSGTTGQPITFSVVNELAPTTASGPYTLRLYSDNPVISLRATQSGTAGEATFSYNWLAACGNGARVSAEPVAPLQVRVLGNPVRDGRLSVEISGVAGQPLTVNLTDASGYAIETRRIDKAAVLEVQRFDISSRSAGVLLLRVSTPTQVQTVKLLKGE